MVCAAVLMLAHAARPLLGLPATILPPALVSAPAHHLRHRELFGAGVPPNNEAVLAGVDRVQATALDGGGYFIGIKANPPESPLGYQVTLGSQPLLAPPRGTSYCSGSSYGAFIEALNQILGSRLGELSQDRVEALRMQEPDGGRREDGVKAWGWWNADGWGCDYCMVQYLGIGDRIDPMSAIPGDFMNISWKSGLGHSDVFLGWGTNAAGQPGVRYWSSQTGTNGLGDQFSPLTKIESVLAVRLTHPEKLFAFDPAAAVEKKLPGDPVAWSN
jgi:hypothetical protein